MTNELYRVDYHVVGAIYLRKGGELSGSDVARLWTTTSIYGHHRVSGAFWHSNAPACKQRTMELGSSEMLDPLLAIGNQPIFGGGTKTKSKVRRGSTLDCDFYYAHDSSSQWFGAETLPYLLLSVSGQWFESVAAETVIDNYKLHFETADRYSPPYGLIDVSASDDCYAGMVYTDTFFANCRIHRWVEQAEWVYSGSKMQNRARGVYWGNYFGNGILNRLGGRDHFLKDYKQQTRNKDGTHNAYIWEFPNGVFVSICLDPTACRPGPPLDGIATRNLLWLVQNLGSRGVLSAWGN